MSQYKLLFSIDDIDNEIVVHLGNGVSISFDTMEEYDGFIEQMQSMRQEIKDTME